MNSYWLLLPVLFPMIAGAIFAPLGLNSRKKMHTATMTVTILTSVFAWIMILFGSTEKAELIRFTQNFVLELKFDGLGRFFAGIVATLWPLTVLYAFSYLEEDEHQLSFFSFFTISFGVTLGVSMSGNIFTLYCFYEFLTLATVPLVMHSQDHASIKAARTYFAFSLGGAAFAFISMMFLATNGLVEQNILTARIFYCIGFFGFGVKAAIFPLHIWLPKASVAPTPVTALLHAVAVVKSGVFAIIRLTWYGYGVDILVGTFAQYIPMAFAIFTILYGSTMAVKESHWKRRMAYSTVSNLSYIIFGALLMTKSGLCAALMHMAFHAEIKILGFFAVGAVLTQTERKYVHELDGMGKKMPITFACFTVSALALTGIPPFSGFVSKFLLLTASAESGTVGAYIGAAIILISALLTAIYMFTVLRRAFFPDKGADLAYLPTVKEADWRMTVPMVILSVGILVTGLLSQQILDKVTEIVSRISW